MDKDDFHQKVEFLTKVAQILSGLNNDIEQEMYVDLVAKKYSVSRDAIKSEIDKKTKKEVKRENKIQLNEKAKQPTMMTLRKKQEEYIVALMLTKDKKTINNVLERFNETDFEYDEIRELFVILKELNAKEDLSKINLLTRFNDETDNINLITEILTIDMSQFDKQKLYNELDNTFKKYYYQKRRAEILGRLSSDISSDEKQMLEIELGQILLKIAKIK